MAQRKTIFKKVSLGAPFAWLAGGWRDLWAAPGVTLIYGLGVALISFALSYALVRSNLSFWALTLSCGFVFVAPMLAMGLYETGRRLEAGERPTLSQALFVKGALRQDIVYLGLALLMIYFMWGRIAQIVYGLSTYRLYRTVPEFADFALNTGEGHTMVITGTIVGGIIAFFTYCIVVVSAPMLLDRDNNVFGATAASFGAVANNFTPLLLWAFIITALLIASAATGFLALTIVFPWLGLASWRAYRALIASPAG